MAVPVDFVMNTFERTYRRILAPGFFAGVAAQHAYPFAKRTILINNVDDRAAAAALADDLVARGELEAWYWVDEQLDRSLATCGLTRAKLGRLPYFTNCLLVALCLPDSPWIVYSDSDVTLDTTGDWITPSLELLARDPRVLGCNPNHAEFLWDREVVEQAGDFALSYGLSDQLFLARRADLAAPIYEYRTLAGCRHNLAHVTPIWEHRVDDYMRCCGKFRATWRPLGYTHHGEHGATYPNWTAGERFRLWRNRQVVRVLLKLGLSDPRYRIYFGNGQV